MIIYLRDENDFFICTRCRSLSHSLNGPLTNPILNPITYVYWHIWSWRPCQRSRIYNPTYHHKLQWYKNTMHLLWMTTLFSHSVSLLGCLEGKLLIRSGWRRINAGNTLHPSSIRWKNFLLKHSHTWHDIKALL